MFYLIAGAFTNHIVSTEAVYLRAFKEEPFLYLSILSGVVTFTLSFLLIPEYGVSGACIIDFMVASFIALPIGTYIFLQRRRGYQYD